MYQALYRKYRPQRFDEIGGQKAIVTTLKNSLETKKINHAYLFYGPRGTGKTTLAKLYAKSINCLHLNNGEPCGECPNCVEIGQKECVDIVEIDAASNNGVDEIRELKNKINLVPSSLKYKVYIIDEVHMLSIGAFNALLKTLEEPPEHVVFILATTEIHKVPSTILSRCQCFCFQKIEVEDIVNRLKIVVEKENIQIDPEVLEEIAYACDGGMRDALGTLDQLSSYTKNKVTIDDYRNTMGTLSFKEMENFLSLIFSKDIKKIIKEIQTFDKNGRNFIQMVNQFLQYLHNILIAYYVEQKKLIYPEQQLVQLIFKFDQLQHNMKNTENPKIIFEVGIIDFVQKQQQIISREIKVESILPSNEDQIISESLNKPEVSIKNEPLEKPSSLKVVQSIFKVDETLLNIRINNTFARASKQQLVSIKEKVPTLREYIFDSQIGFLICLILDGTIRAASEEHIIISYEYESMVEKAWKHEKELTKQILNHLNIKTNLLFITDEKWEQLRKEFINKKEQNIPYQYVEEPIKKEIETPQTENTLNNSEIDTYQKAVDIFGDIVEVES